jgi:hypothetical protein
MASALALALSPSRKSRSRLDSQWRPSLSPDCTTDEAAPRRGGASSRRRMHAPAARIGGNIRRNREVRVNPAQEGWYTDPWGRHEARWISEGVPSKLVRDGDLESYDQPPDSPPTHAWVQIEPLPGSVTAADTLRADGAEAETMPSLAELKRRENSAAITARAHPWIVTRDWVRTAQPLQAVPAKPISAARRIALVAGGVVSGLLLLLVSSLWVVLIIELLTPPPPIWSGVVVCSLIVLVPPIVIWRTWRGDRLAKLPVARRVQRAEAIGGFLVILSFMLLVAVRAAM